MFDILSSKGGSRPRAIRRLYNHVTGVVRGCERGDDRARLHCAAGRDYLEKVGKEKEIISSAIAFVPIGKNEETNRGMILVGTLCQYGRAPARPERAYQS